MVGTAELITPVDPAVQENPPASANMDMVNFLEHITHITVPCHALRVGAIVPEAKNL